jgi:hypothetical protein
LSNKLSKQAQTLIEVSPLLKICLIQRLSDKDSIEFLNKNGFKMSPATYQRYKHEYNQGTNRRFLEIARNEWANEHLLVLDKLKYIENQYWELYKESAETPMVGKSILDSIRTLQIDLLIIYNETPMIAKVKETLDARLNMLELKKIETT